MDAASTLRDAIAAHADRLDQASNGGDQMSQRTKKRVLQAIGRLNRELQDLLSPHDAVAAAVGSKRGRDEVDECNEPSRLLHPHIVDASINSCERIYSKEERKLKLRLLNKVLSECAQKKQLRLAVKKVAWGRRKGIKLDVHSYANLINAYVRCGDVAGAEKSFKEMQDDDVRPNLVVYTTLMKGYCELGDTGGACGVYFKRMVRDGLQPNTRALNTLLRGCVRTGMYKPALVAYCEFKSRVNSVSVLVDSSALDSSTYEYLVGMLCRCGLLSQAEMVVEAMVGSRSGHLQDWAAGGVSAIDNSAIYLSLASANAMLGRCGAAVRWVRLSQECFDSNGSTSLKHVMREKFEQSMLDGMTCNDSSVAPSSGAVRSVEVFLKHRKTELASGCRSILSHLSSVAPYVMDPTDGSTCSLLVDDLGLQFRSCAHYLQCISNVLYFGFDGRGDYDSSHLPRSMSLEMHMKHTDEQVITDEARVESFPERLIYALRDKFGLDRITLAHWSGDQSVAGVLGSTEFENSTARKKGRLQYLQLKRALRDIKQNVVLKHLSVFGPPGSSPVIDWLRLFSTVLRPPDTDESTRKALMEQLPIKLEICSGNGEWVTAQANADYEKVADRLLPRALWVAVELRCDRVQYTASHYFLSSHAALAAIDSLRPEQSAHQPPHGAELTIGNLAVLGGDASIIIPNHFADCSVSDVFVNHPQPPERLGRLPFSQGSHLLTGSFLKELHRVLRPRGRLTIVTDNYQYAKDLAQCIAELGQQVPMFAGASQSNTGNSAWDHQLDDSFPTSFQGCIEVWRGDPGPEVRRCGTGGVSLLLVASRNECTAR